MHWTLVLKKVLPTMCRENTSESKVWVAESHPQRMGPLSHGRTPENSEGEDGQPYEDCVSALASEDRSP
jgi:hypothetical protein